jgi:hypothetical protein
MTRRAAGEKEKRVPINGNRNHFSDEGLDTKNFHYCWVNDIINQQDDNIYTYLRAGYEFVLTDDKGNYITDPDRGSSMTGLKKSKPVGAGRTAFLMRVPIEIYNQDLEEYHAEIDNREVETIRRNEGQYGSVEIKPGFTRRNTSE